MIIRYEYKAEDLSKFSKWEEGKYTRNLVHQGDHHQNNDKDALIGRGQKWSTLAPSLKIKMTTGFVPQM